MRAATSTILLATLCLTAGTGCQTVHPQWPKSLWGGSSSKLHESKYPTPIKMAVIWSPAVYNRAGEPTVRGLGGRIYFYDAKNKPVPVEGQLVVYAYNDSGDCKTPERKFAFTPEQFTQHYSPTELGASYSVWIPWDPIGRPQVELTLVPVFTATSGQLVVGEPSHNLLPGPTTPKQESQISRMTLPPSPVIRVDAAAFTRPEYAVQPASFQQNPAAGWPPQESSGLNTMSITLPGSMADQLANAPPQTGPLERLAIQRATLTAGRLAASSAAVLPPSVPAATAPKSPSPWAVPPPWSQATPQQARYGQPSPQAPSAPALQPTVGPPPSPLFPAAQPSVPLATR
jgi:hypothetical protein